MITLYDCSTAPSPRRARMLLAEKGIEHATVAVDLAAGEQFSPAYRAINPLCTVPALRLEDGTVLGDNAAIEAYVDARWPDPPLRGRTPLERAEVATWAWRCEFEGLMAVAEALRNGSPAMVNRALPGPVEHAQIPALAERGVLRTRDFFETLNQRLAGREWLATDTFTMADLIAVVVVDFARVVRVKATEEHPHLLRWRAALAQRPSVHR